MATPETITELSEGDVIQLLLLGCGEVTEVGGVLQVACCLAALMGVAPSCCGGQRHPLSAVGECFKVAEANGHIFEPS